MLKRKFVLNEQTATELMKPKFIILFSTKPDTYVKVWVAKRVGFDALSRVSIERSHSYGTQTVVGSVANF